jgi:hypothetical protein
MFNVRQISERTTVERKTFSPWRTIFLFVWKRLEDTCVTGRELFQQDDEQMMAFNSSPLLLVLCPFAKRLYGLCLNRVKVYYAISDILTVDGISV